MTTYSSNSAAVQSPAPKSGCAVSGDGVASATASRAGRFGRKPVSSRVMCIVLAALSVLTAIAAPDARAAHASRAFLVRQFHFEGNTLFTDQELQTSVAGYAGRKLTAAQIEEARNKVTQFYIDHHYNNSGARLIGTDERAGIVYFRVVEGKVEAVNVSGNRWFSSSYLKSRITRDGMDPYRPDQVATNIAVLRHYDLNGNILALDADLQPGDKSGDGVLNVTVQDRQPFRAAIVYDNRRPAGVGAQEVSLLAQDVNLTGVGDSLTVDYVIAHETKDGYVFSDKDNLTASYTRPITPYETSVTVSYSRQDFTVIAAPFQDLDIDSNERIYSISLRQPIIRKPTMEFALSLRMDREESHTSLLGMPFTLSPGAINGTANLTVFRFVQDFTYQKNQDLVALRSTFSVGTKLFGGTEDTSDRDAKFFSWQGEAQYVRQFNVLNLNNLLVLRANGQVTSDPLLVLEQYSVGGRDSVRGYRENELVRDSGYLFSAEVRVPIIKYRGEPLVQLAPFVDLGGGFNNESPTPRPRFLASIGVGLLLTFRQYVSGELYYGYALKDVDEGPNSDRDLQDDGIHFTLRVGAF